MLSKLDRKKLLILGVIFFLILLVCGAIFFISQSKPQDNVEIEEQSSTSSSQNATTSVESTSTSSSSTTTSLGLKNVEFIVGSYGSNGQPVEAGELKATLQMPDDPSLIIDTSNRSTWKLISPDFTFTLGIGRGESAGAAYTVKRGELNHPQYGLIYLMDNYFVTASLVRLTEECNVGYVQITHPAPCTSNGSIILSGARSFIAQCISESESGIQNCIDILRSVVVGDV